MRSLWFLVPALGCLATPPEPTSPPTGAGLAKAGSEANAAASTAERTGEAEDRWLTPATAQAEATRILDEIAAARNLPVTGPVNVDVVDKPGIRAFAQRAMYEHTSREELQLLGRVQASMGVIPRGADPEQIVLDLLEDGVAGFYDPERKTLFIGDFVDKVTLSMVVGHEIAHGLQDMHFDLTKHQLPLRHRSDEEVARRFLIEGEAQATYLAWVAGDSGLAAIDDAVLDAMGNMVLDGAEMASDYPILARSLQLPYADGTATVARLVREKGWDAVDALYESLPASSEQMLHIEKLAAREAPIPTTVDAAALDAVLPGSSAAVVWHDTLGEAELLAMLAQAEPSTVARRAAAGWGGDHYVAVALEGGVPSATAAQAAAAAIEAATRGDKPSNDGDRKAHPSTDVPMVVAATVWDSEQDAEEFEAVFSDYLQAQVPDHAIERQGDTVLFVTGIPAQIDAAALVSAAWAGVDVGPRPSARQRRRQRRRAARG